MKNKYLILILLLLPIIVFSKNTYVIDNASIIDKYTSDYIDVYSNFIYNKCGIEYYVITIDSLSSNTIEEETDYLYNKYNISSNGLLIVVSKSDRELRVKAGTSLSDVISNKTIDEYINKYFIPYLENNEWSSGIKNGYSSFYKLLCNYYGIDSSSMVVYRDSFINKYKYETYVFLIFICNLLTSWISNYIFNSKKRDTSTLKDSLVVVGIILVIYLLVVEYYLTGVGVVIPIGFIVVKIYSFINKRLNKGVKSIKK